MRKVFSEVKYVLEETSRGSNPKWRRWAKKEANRFRRQADKVAISESLCEREVEIERAPYEFVVDIYAELGWDCYDKHVDTEILWDWRKSKPLQGFSKEIQCGSLWHNHELEMADQAECEIWWDKRNPWASHPTTWEEDLSWEEDADEYFKQLTA